MVADLIIDGVTVRSSVVDLKTGVKKPFEPYMWDNIMISILKHMTAEQIMALPESPAGAVPTLEARIHPDGKIDWIDLTNKKE